MKKLLILFLSLTTFAFAQENEDTKPEKKSRSERRKERKLALAEKKVVYPLEYPKGIYFSLEELISKEPKKTSALVVQKRPTGSIKRKGGNDYKLYDSNFNFSHSDVKNKIFAYSNGTELFINGTKYDLQHYYFRVVNDGKYLVFKSGIPTNAKKESVQMQIASTKAPVGKKMSGPFLATMRFVYILNKETGKITVVDKRNIESIIGDVPSLLNRYNLEDQKSSTETLLKYIVEYNGLTDSEKIELNEK